MVEKQIRAKNVCFWLYHGASKLVEGRFTALRSRGQSCYGDYREFALLDGGAAAAIFGGVLFEHSLDADGSASIGLRYLAAVPDAASPCGYSQKEVVKACLSMGAESGLDALESVMLGEEHEFVFRSHSLA